MSAARGRFRRPLHPEALAFSSSLAVDRRLVAEDIAGSVAHVRMLARRGIIPGPAAARIVRGLKVIAREWKEGRFPSTAQKRSTHRLAADDIHMAVEQRLAELVGPVAGLLHTARSRNDQVALDERLFLVRTGEEIKIGIAALQRALVRKAEQYRTVLMPGYTHLQRAQPILLAHHLLAYVAMLERDAARLTDCLRRASASPLGAAALAGTPFPVDRRGVARATGLAGIVTNSMDAVSDRDALIEFIGAAAIGMMHLSRLAEDLILWVSREWRFVQMGEEFTTGSSIMPQKQNPDMAELVRGKAGRVYGDLMALLTVMKGLPLAYNRDMQEDKEPLFDAADTYHSSLRIMALMVPGLVFDRKRFAAELERDFLLATDLADYLVRKGMSFREAHTAVGEVVRRCEQKGRSLQEMSLEEYRLISSAFDGDLYAVLTPAGSIKAKRSEGSTSAREVGNALRRWKKKLW